MSFLRIQSTHKGYNCMDLKTLWIYYSRDVIFHEDTFPYSVSWPDSTIHSSPPNPTYVPLPILNPLLPLLGLGPLPPISPSHPTHSPSSSSQIHSILNSQTSSAHDQFLAHSNPSPILTPPRSPIITRSQINSSKPYVWLDGTIPYPSRTCLATTVSPPESPTSYIEASKHSTWHTIMSQEYQALLKNQTWSLVPPNPNVNVLGCRWVYKNKLHADGTIERRKATLIAKGYHHQHGLDFHETFSPLVKAPTIQLMLSIAITHKWPLRQLNIHNAFLHGTLTDQVFMHQPQGFINPQFPDYIYKLHKAIYGLKQAPRAWFAQLSPWLLDYGFVASQFDALLFGLNHGDLPMYLLVYVDNFIITVICC